MSKPDLVIAIISCKKNAALRDVARRTWLTGCPYQYYFFIGGTRPQNAASDEVYLDCPDTYEALAAKTINMLDYLSKKKYRYVLKCDDDSYVYWKNIEIADYRSFDYAGSPHLCTDRDYFYEKVALEHRKPLKDELEVEFAQGMGYFLSERAINVILANSSKEWDGQMRLEDEYVGDTLYTNGIKLKPISTCVVNDIGNVFGLLSGAEWRKPERMVIHGCTKHDLLALSRERNRLLRVKYIAKRIWGALAPRFMEQLKNPHVPVKIAGLFGRGANRAH